MTTRPGSKYGPGAPYRSESIRDLVTYSRGYILALEDVLQDNTMISETQPGYRPPWQLIQKIEKTLRDARRTLEILLHDQEAGGYPDEP